MFDHSDYENRLDFQVSRTFARSRESNEKLLPYFLGILPDDKYNEYKILQESEMLSELTNIKPESDQD